MFDKHKSPKQSTPVTQEPRVSQPAPAMSSKPVATSSNVAMIGHGIQITGDVKADSNLRIEGRIEGRSIQCTHNVEVGDSGQVNASIMAKVVKISGAVAGDIGGSEKVLITASGRVQGNIIAPRVQLEDGALFRGSIDMNPAEKASAEKPATVKQAAPKTAQPEKPAASTAAPSSAARKEPSLNLKSG
ncbi:polymer-forming cytoskeletal protein [Pseudomonadota bacterium]